MSCAPKSNVSRQIARGWIKPGTLFLWGTLFVQTDRISDLRQGIAVRGHVRARQSITYVPRHVPQTDTYTELGDEHEVHAGVVHVVDVGADRDDKGKVKRDSAELLKDGVPQRRAVAAASELAMDFRETIARVMHKVCGIPARKRTWGSGVMLLFDIGAARRQQKRNLLGCNAVGRVKAQVT